MLIDGDDAGLGRDVDDPPTALPQHLAAYELGQHEGRAKIDGHGHIPVDLGDGLGRCQPRDTSIIHQHVDLPWPGDDPAHHGFTAETVLAAILVLAVVQVFVHIVYFLHMDRSAEQRWNVVAFAFTVMILVIVVSGSVWIMHNATSNMEHSMAPTSAEGVIPQK